MVVGDSRAMRALMERLEAAAKTRMDVLLVDETGTGKELIARLIHDSAPRPGPYVAINCAAIPSELLESALFGVQGRVATGVDPRIGLFERAAGGSILLDEIGELPSRLQPKLLRVLQEREVLPIGAATPRKIDVRVISATNRCLEALIATGEFRADLYYRLRGLEFHIPPLRERREDIPPLVLEFVRRAAAEHGKSIDGVSEAAMNVLVSRDWPGNVRELRTEVWRAVLACPAGGVLRPEHFDFARSSRVEPEEAAPQTRAATLRDHVDATEREHIAEALAAAGGNRSKAARLLGITRNGLALKMKRLGIAGRERQ